MDVKLIILLGIVTIVRDENDMVVTHGLDHVFQKVSARRHIFQKDPFLELAAVANHGMEGEGIEHPTSGTSFIETVAILDVVAVSAATFDVYLKQFLDAMDVVVKVLRESSVPSLRSESNHLLWISFRVMPPLFFARWMVSTSQTYLFNWLIAILSCFILFLIILVQR